MNVVIATLLKFRLQLLVLLAVVVIVLRFSELLTPVTGYLRGRPSTNGFQQRERYILKIPKRIPGTRPFFHTDIPMYYVNLDRSSSRRRNMEHAFNNTGKLQRIEAVDVQSNLLDYVDLSGTDGTLADVLKKVGKKVNSAGELALTMSHFKAIRTAYEAGDEVALILEDDASPALAPYWLMSLDDVVQKANEANPKWKVIRLQYIFAQERTMTEILKFLSKDEWSPQLVSGKPGIWGAVSYLISRDGMKLLMDRFKGSEGRFDCRQRRKNKCQSDFLLQDEFEEDETLIMVPPMFTVLCHEDHTGVRDEKVKHSRDWRDHSFSIADAFRLAIDMFERHATVHPESPPTDPHRTRWDVHKRKSLNFFQEFM